jgi:hypothetical protein
LNQIKVLQTLNQQQTAMQQGHVRGANHQTMLSISVKITQTKQQIQNLQNQINAQQGIFNKSQHPGGGPPGMGMMGPDQGINNKMMGPGGGGGQGGLFGGGSTSSGHEAGFGSIMNAMSNMSVAGQSGGDGSGHGQQMSDHSGGNGGGGGQQAPQSSRFFNDWRLNEGKDGMGQYGNEFSRAPGTMPSKGDYPGSSSAATTGMLGAPTDGPWSSSLTKNEGGWPDSGGPGGNPSSQGGQWGGGGGNQAPSAAAASGYNISDLPEFEPGKPWKVREGA